MGYSLEIKTSSRQEQTSKVVNEKILSPRANQSIKLRDNCKVKGPFGQPHLDRYHELRQSAGDGLGLQLKSPGNNHQQQWPRSKVNKDDELVKHMSNLPDYLQRVERGEYLQGKALNFGVLDWERLEKWKYDEKSVPAGGNTKGSASSSKPSTSQGSYVSSSHGEKFSDVGRSQGKVVRVQKVGTLPISALDGQQNLHWRDKLSIRNNSEIKIDRGKWKECDQKTAPKNENLSLNWEKHGFSLSSRDTMKARDGETKIKVKKEFNVAHENCPGEQQSIVLLLPKHQPSKRSAENFQRLESRSSFEANFTEINGKGFPDCFCPVEFRTGLYSEIPHSCPLPVGVATNDDSVTNPCSSSDVQDMELQSESCCMHLSSDESDHIPSSPSKDKYLEESKSNMKRSTLTPIEISKRLDLDLPEQTDAKGKYPLPNRRFRFSFGRMSRSFSFRESSVVPQLTSAYVSVKSGPIKCETSVDSDNFSRDKANSNNRARASPLRRLLDPLFKPKGAHSTETNQSSKGNLNSTSFKPITANKLVQDKKHEESAFQALLQLTMRNGLPFFKLVVDNSNVVLVATVRKLPIPNKGDSSLIYAFYSVHEIKKKSGGWISPGSKGKSCGFGYNIVGQMKVSSSNLPYLTGEDSEDEFMVRESVLYGVDNGQLDKQMPELLTNRELAAIVVKNPIVNFNDGGEQREKSDNFTRKGFAVCEPKDNGDMGDSKILNSTTVILPGGVHGVPNQGASSPLINRWRSGGSCDCGGWDVGCRLQVLTNKDQSSNISRPSISFSVPDQGGDQESKPIFSLTPFKNGLYSVDFNAPISLLQGFSMCVAVITNQKLYNFLEMNDQSKEKLFPEPTTQLEMMKNPILVQREVPAKYVLFPPTSPVGRI